MALWEQSWEPLTSLLPTQSVDQNFVTWHRHCEGTWEMEPGTQEGGRCMWRIPRLQGTQEEWEMNVENTQTAEGLQTGHAGGEAG